MYTSHHTEKGLKINAYRNNPQINITNKSNTVCIYKNSNEI